MSRNYMDDVKAGGLTQIHPNDDQGGILWFDYNEVVAQLDPENGESHQLHISRGLTDEESAEFDRLLGPGNECAEWVDEKALEIVETGQLLDKHWIDAGVINQQARDYLLSLRA